MAVDLQDFARRFEEAPTEDTSFTAECLEAPPAELVTSGTVAQIGQSHYGSFRVDRVVVAMTPHDCLRLGLLVAAVLLHGGRSTVSLANSRSQLRRIVVAADQPLTEQGYRAQVTEVLFWRRSYSRAPWYPLPGFMNRFDLPHVRLSNLHEKPPVTEAEWSQRDTLFGFGSFGACAQVSNLLLNAAALGERQSEFVLAHEPGPAGVVPGSCELQLFVAPGGA